MGYFSEMDIEGEFYFKEPTLDNALNKAYQAEDAKKYAFLCDTYGFLPYDEDFYQEGKTKLEKDKLRREGKSVLTKQQVKDLTFISQGKSLYDGGMFYALPEKKNLLMKYFFKFSKEGKQNLTNVELNKIGPIFNGVYETYNKNV